MTYPHPQCEVFGHAWFEYYDDWAPDFGIPIVLRCERCSKVRHDAISRTSGDLLHRSYINPTDAHPGPRPSMAERRLNLIHTEPRRQAS